MVNRKNVLLEKINVFSEVLEVLNSGNQTQKSPITEATVDKFQEIKNTSKVYNPWFTDKSIEDALLGLAQMLRSDALSKWINDTDLARPKTGKSVGMVLAGNIPMVGFHDIFTTCLAGHKAIAKLSSQDKVLLPSVFDAFNEALGTVFFEIDWIDGKLKGMDAVIATGSNNTSRYFEYYFGKYPHIIRKNRNSVAILTGEETDDELKALGQDIFSHFGKGCRNVSKLYVHNNFILDRFFEAIFGFKDIINHNKYANNFDYYRALWLMNREDLLENGFLLLRPSTAIASPIATLFYERFESEDRLRAELGQKSDEIQCIVSKHDIPFGQSQKPELWDYADGVNTAEFVLRF